MKKSASSDTIKRRQFIARSFAAGTSICFGCSHFFSSVNAREVQVDKTFQDKISQNSGMSYEQVYNFAFRNPLILQLKALSNQIGREKFVEMLKKATDEVYSDPNTSKNFRANLPDQFMTNVTDLEVIENSRDVRIYKVTKCLWAKTFRESDAADIGYAYLCYGDYASAKASNEKLERETTLMQGHDCCLFKWTRIS